MTRALHWFRKDLRLDDNTALSEATRACDGDVVPFYTGEPAILARDDVAPTRIRFVLDSLADLGAAVARAGSRLVLDHGDAVATVTRAAERAGARIVTWNDEYEPDLVARDQAVEAALVRRGVEVRRYHDRLLVPPGAVANASGAPYTVYTPFRRACEALPVSAPLAAVTTLRPHGLPARPPATLGRLGVPEPASERWPAGAAAAARRLARFAANVADYAAGRDRPAAAATSRLSADLRFGTLGVRRVVREVEGAAGRDPRARAALATFVSELRWRDFYAHVLWHFPHAGDGAFRAGYDRLRWEGGDDRFAAWAAGRTGYPMVDAGMRELAATGWMHNRARMIVASFLTKDLLVDWRRGERHFMRHLVDGDLASNNGGWQWTAGTGTDAQPWFRVFNPTLQSRKFDPDGRYVKRWVPELARLAPRDLHAPWAAAPLALAEAGVRLGRDYPRPMVDHAVQRERALAMHRAAAG